MVFVGSMPLVLALWAWGGAFGIPEAPAPDQSPGVEPASLSVHAPTLTGAYESQRQRELEELQRRDVAASLTRFGVTVDWREHALADLVDWQGRLEVVSMLRADWGIELDWRQMSLGDLEDLRLRIAKATEIASSLGVTVDWRRYSWWQLEELRRAVAKIQSPDGDGAGRGRRVAAARSASGSMRARDLQPILEL